MFQNLANYLEWANSRTFESLTGLSEPPENAIRTFSHILAAEEIWLGRLTGNFSQTEVWPMHGFESAREWIKRNAAGYKDYLSHLDDTGLTKEIVYQNSKGRNYSSVVGDILMQVFSHGSYHRGQIAVTVKAYSGQPASTDYILFARGSE